MPEHYYLEMDEARRLEPEFLHEKDKDGNNKPNPKAGQPGPLVAFGMQVATPTMVNGELIGVTESKEIVPSDAFDENDPWGARIIPGTAIIHTTNERVRDGVLGRGDFKLIDPPASEQPRKPKQKEEVAS